MIVWLLSLFVIFPLLNFTPQTLCRLRSNHTRTPKSFGFFLPREYWYLCFVKEQRHSIAFWVAAEAGKEDCRVSTPKLELLSVTLSFATFGSFSVPENISWSVERTGNRGFLTAVCLGLLEQESWAPAGSFASQTTSVLAL